MESRGRRQLSSSELRIVTYRGEGGQLERDAAGTGQSFHPAITLPDVAKTKLDKAKKSANVDCCMTAGRIFC